MRHVRLPWRRSSGRGTPVSDTFGYKPQDGDWVRVVLEGEVATSAQGFWIGGKGTDGEFANEIIPRSRHVVLVEKIPAPVKVGDVLTNEQVVAGQWRPGTVFRMTAISGFIGILLRTRDSVDWWACSDGNDYPDRHLTNFWNDIAFEVIHLP